MRTYFVTAICLIVSCAVGAQEEKLKEVRGTIRQIDLKTGGVILQVLSSDKQLPMSMATKELPVTDPLGAKLTMNDLRAELRIAAKVRGEDEIVAIRIDGPYQHGMVKKIDLAQRQIVYKDVYAEKTITIPAEAKIIATGKEASLDVFKPGDPIQLLYTPDKKTILQVQTGKGTNIRDPYLRITRYYGILADLDHAKRNVQVFVQSTDAGTIKTYDVSPDAFLRTMYHFKPVAEIGFDQFAKWVKVYYYIDRDTGKVVNMDADLPVMIRRKVLKVDAKAETITVADDLKEKTLPLAADLKVLTPRGDGKLAEIEANRIVNCALSLDRSRVQVLYLWDR